MMADIGWLVSNVTSADIAEVTSSELASSRMRAGVCINAALQNSFTVSKLNLIEERTYPKLLFMSKYVHDSGTNRFIQDGGIRWDLWLNLIRELKNKGTKFIVDYTDHHLDGYGVVASFYKEVLPYIDGFVVPSNMMMKNISNFSNRPVWVIPEPVEVSITKPKISRVNSDKLNILWFGHNSNLPFLFRMIQGALRNAPPHNLVILSNYLDQSQFAKVAALGHKLATYNYGKWSLELMEKISKKVDVCVIPGDTTDPKKNGVSPGRLLTSLAMGLPTIATPLDSYLPFAKYFASDDNPDALKGIFDNPLAYRGRIVEAQGLIQDEYTVSAVGSKWLQVCHEIINL